MPVTSREELKEYALRRLGAPVVNINVDDLQLEDRIDEALQVFHEWHYDGTEKLYLKHKLEASHMVLDSTFPADTLKKGWYIRGITSGTKATVWKQSGPGTVDFYLADKEFILGEELYIGPTWETSVGGYSAHIQNIAGAIELNEFENRYIPVDSSVLSVIKIFPITAGKTSNYLFDGQYYTMMDVMYNFKGGDLIHYDMTKQYINLVNALLVGEKPVRFNHITERLYLDLDWLKAIAPDSYLIIECYKIVDPITYTKIWDDQFLKAYTTCLFKMQFAQNLSKFSNIQLLGGVMLDATKMMDEAQIEKDKLEEKLRTQWSMPLGFSIA